MAEKECLHCKLLYKMKTPWQQYCTESCAKRAKSLRHKSQGKAKYYQYKADLKRLYGLTIDDYNVLLKEQDGNCSICGINHTNLTGRKKEALR